MSVARVNFEKNVGKIKPMHAVNNGPVYKFAADQRITNIDAFMDAGIPYARNHDASFYATYGGEHTVDVHMIFPNFDADPTDPESYDFACTDEYLRVIDYAGIKTFYRLGSKIEHAVKKYGTLPPKDFKKWAVICEHIIRHYTEGWADGFRYDMEYWEIWNEPDLDPDDSTNKRCWGGTQAQFFELYHVTATHLKACFPHLKIGGPAIAGNMKWAEAFLAQLKAPLDFFSWHRYAFDPRKIATRAAEVRALLDKYGFADAESILNEWNYVRGWTGDDWLYSLRNEKGLKGASFISSVMCDSQNGSVDLLMYYDARPCGMNGMFNTDFVCDKLKGYYPFYMFGQLYRLCHASEVSSDDDLIHLCAASGDGEYAALLSYFDDDDQAPSKELSVELCGFPSSENGTALQVYLLDEDRNCELVSQSVCFGEHLTWKTTATNFSSYLFKLTAL